MYLASSASSGICLSMLAYGLNRLLTCFPAVGWRRNQKRKSGKNSCFEIKAVLVTWAKAMHLRKVREGINSVPISRQVLSILTTAVLHHMQWWLGETSIIPPNLPPFFFPQLLSAEHNTIWCSQFLLTGGVRSRKGLDYCWTGLTQLNHPWIINAASRTNPKHSPYQWLWRKINYPVKSSTLSNLLWCIANWSVRWH